MDPYLAELRERERAAYRLYNRKLWEFFDARDDLGRMIISWNPIPAEEIEAKQAEVDKLDLDQWNAWKHYKQVIGECSYLEWFFNHPPTCKKIKKNKY